MNFFPAMPEAESRKLELEIRCPKSSRLRRPAPGGRPVSAFTLIEIAISLAVIGIALVAIIGVLPLGMNVQRENREGTVINQDATIFIEGITKGARGLDDLTNYLFSITNNWVLFNPDGSVKSSGANNYNFNGSTVTWPLSTGFCRLTNGFHIIGLLSTPEFTDNFGAGTNNLFSGGYSNHIIAYVRSISGGAAEKPPQDNQIMRGGATDSGDAFAYRLLCVNAAVPVDTNLFFTAATNWSFSRQLAGNLHELRLTFFWPIQPNGKVGLGRQTYRALVAGRMEHVYTNGNDLYFYQSQSFTNAP